MFSIIAAALIGIMPANDAKESRVDLIELNSTYDEHGRLVFDQWIFWDFNHIESRWQVVDWRLVKPHYYRIAHQVIMLDGMVLRRIRAPLFRRTWTQFDPEMLDRSTLGKEYRRGL